MRIIAFIVLLLIAVLSGVILEKEINLSNLAKTYGGSPEMQVESGQMEKSEKETTTKNEDNILYWVAPMDPNYRRDEPGKSPMGMDLIPVRADGEVSEESDGMPIVKIRPEVVNNLGVRTEKVKRDHLWRKINTVGYIDYDETRISHIHTRTEGWIGNLKVRAEGEPVKRGQLLFELYSPLLVNAQEEYLQAIAIANNRLIEASREKLSALGVSKSQINQLEKDKKVKQNVRFYAPQSGVLNNLGVRDGMYVKPDTQVLSIANLDSIWLIAEIFERQASWVKAGQIAEAELPSMPGQLWEGEVEYIYPELDPVTRTLRVRLRFDNTGLKLMPNMYAHVSILGSAKIDVISIPREALIRDVDTDRIILALGDGRFQARDVIAGIESGDLIEIKSGLNEGDKIVVSSQFLIDSESSLKASFNRMQSVNDTNDNVMTTDPVVSYGVIKTIYAGKNTLEIKHDAITEWDRPSMTMDFDLNNNTTIEDLKEGDEIRFKFVKRGKDQFIIQSIYKLNINDRDIKE